MTDTPEKVYSRFMTERNFIKSCWLSGLCTEADEKKALAHCFAHYMEVMGEELFETFLDAERQVYQHAE